MEDKQNPYQSPDHGTLNHTHLEQRPVNHPQNHVHSDGVVEQSNSGGHGASSCPQQPGQSNEVQFNASNTTLPEKANPGLSEKSDTSEMSDVESETTTTHSISEANFATYADHIMPNADAIFSSQTSNFNAKPYQSNEPSQSSVSELEDAVSPRYVEFLHQGESEWENTTLTQTPEMFGRDIASYDTFDFEKEGRSGTHSIGFNDSSVTSKLSAIDQDDEDLLCIKVEADSSTEAQFVNDPYQYVPGIANFGSENRICTEFPSPQSVAESANLAANLNQNKAEQPRFPQEIASSRQRPETIQYGEVDEIDQLVAGGEEQPTIPIEKSGRNDENGSQTNLAAHPAHQVKKGTEHNLTVKIPKNFDSKDGVAAVNQLHSNVDRVKMIEQPSVKSSNTNTALPNVKNLRVDKSNSQAIVQVNTAELETCLEEGIANDGILSSKPSPSGHISNISSPNLTGANDKADTQIEDSMSEDKQTSKSVSQNKSNPTPKPTTSRLRSDDRDEVENASPPKSMLNTPTLASRIPASKQQETKSRGPPRSKPRLDSVESNSSPGMKPNKKNKSPSNPKLTVEIPKSSPLAKKSSKNQVVDDEVEIEETDRPSKKKSGLVDLTSTDVPVADSLQPTKKRSPTKRPIAPKSKKGLVNDIVQIDSDSNYEPTPRHHPKNGTAKRRASKAELSSESHASTKRQKIKPEEERDEDYTGSTNTARGPVLGGVNTRSVKRSAAIVEPAIRSQPARNQQPFGTPGPEETSQKEASQHRSNLADKKTAPEQKPKTLPQTPTKRPNPEDDEVKTPVKKPRGNAKKSSIQAKNIVSPAKRTAIDLTRPESRGEIVEKLVVVLRRYLKNTSNKFPRFESGDVYINLTLDNSTCAYRLHSELLYQLSDWFKWKYDVEIPEPDYALSEMVKDQTGLKARFELTFNQKTGRKVLLKTPFTMIKTESGSNSTTRTSHQAQEEERKTFDDFENVFRACYSLPLKLDHKNIQNALQQTEATLDIAKVHGFLSVIRPHLNAHLLNFGRELYKSIVQEPPRWLQLSLWIQSTPIFKEALLHIVGNYPKWQHEAVERVRNYPYEVEYLIDTKINDFRKKKANIDGDLFKTNHIEADKEKLYFEDIDEHTYNTWLVNKCWNDWFEYSIAKANTARISHEDATMYRRMLQGGNAYLDINTVCDIIETLRGRALSEEEFLEIENDLTRLKQYAQEKVQSLCVNESMVLVGDEDIKHFLCVEVSDHERPWLKSPSSPSST